MRFQTTIFALVTLAYSSLTGAHKPEPETSDLSIIRSELSILTAPKIVSESTVFWMLDFNYCSGTIVAEDKILTALHTARFCRGCSVNSRQVRTGSPFGQVTDGLRTKGTPKFRNTLISLFADQKFCRLLSGQNFSAECSAEEVC